MAIIGGLPNNLKSLMIFIKEYLRHGHNPEFQMQIGFILTLCQRKSWFQQKVIDGYFENYAAQMNKLVVLEVGLLY